MVGEWIHKHILRNRKPNFIIGGESRPYMLRWYVIPRNRWFNIYLHCFKRSDDDRALHDHPWASLSIVLDGQYIEHFAQFKALRRRWAFAFRGAKCAHRVELINDRPSWTLFITGPKVRDWGFHCPNKWVPWKKFVSRHPGEIGAGCE